MNQNQREAVISVCDLALKAGGMQIKGKVDLVLSLLLEDIKQQNSPPIEEELGDKKMKKK